MKKYIIVLIVLVQSTVLMAQKNNQIKYILPDAVEVLLDSCVKNIANEKVNFYFLLKKDSTYNITIGKYSKREKKSILRWIKQSNRFVVINSKSYPLIFDYDLKFAVIDDSNIGEFGIREGNTKRVNLILHGFTIYFTADGNIVNTK